MTIKVSNSKAIRVGLVDRRMAVIEFIVATANYLLAEEAAKEALKAAGLDPDDYPYIMLADVEIIEPNT
jgi:3-oxoacyl-[acyl-carrier-protein] synthase III